MNTVTFEGSKSNLACSWAFWPVGKILTGYFNHSTRSCSLGTDKSGNVNYAWNNDLKVQLWGENRYTLWEEIGFYHYLPTTEGLT